MVEKLRSDSLIVLVRLAVAALGILTIPILTRLISPQEYGTYSLMLTLVALCSTIPLRWLNAATLRYAGHDSAWDIFNTVWRGLVLTLPIAAASGALAAHLLLRDRRLVTVAIVLIVAEGSYATWLMVTRARRALRAFASGAITRALGILAGIGTVWLIQPGVPSALDVLIASAAAVILATMLMLHVLRPWGSSHVAHGVGVWFRFGSPLILAQLFTLGSLSAPKIAVFVLSGPEALGRFSPTFDLLSAGVGLSISLIGFASIPQINSMRDSAARRAKLLRLRRQLVLGAAIIALLCGAAWPAVSAVLIEPSHRLDGFSAPMVLLVAFCLQGLQVHYVNTSLHLVGATWWQTVSSFIGILTTVALLVVLVPRTGNLGASVSYLCGTVAMLLWSGVYFVSNAWSGRNSV